MIDIKSTLQKTAQRIFEELNPESTAGNDPVFLVTNETNSVIAIIISDHDDDNGSTCYAIVGQHSQISPEYIIENCTGIGPDNIDDAETVLYQLVSVGYKPLVAYCDTIENVIHWHQLLGLAKQAIGS